MRKDSCETADTCLENPPQVILKTPSIKTQDFHQCLGIYMSSKMKYTVRRTCQFPPKSTLLQRDYLFILPLWNVLTLPGYERYLKGPPAQTQKAGVEHSGFLQMMVISGRGRKAFLISTHDRIIS